MESLAAAVESGADAVYFGGGAFSARQYAENFTPDELRRGIDYAHLRGAKAYITVNTLVKDSELESAAEFLHSICEMGADAVIIQDTGLFAIMPGIPVHASTQMTVHNTESARMLSELGVKRVILSRELSLEEMAAIKRDANIEIEAFVHGALCICYSGQCLMSSMIGGRSGNRGYCAQPCRKRYRMRDKSGGDMSGYLLSPRDLCTAAHLGKLIEAGIDAFKIEGRMKRPEYVAGVTGIYRRLIDRYAEDPAGYAVTDDEMHELAQLFSRGFTEGYFFGKPGGELISRERPDSRGTYLGEVIKYDNRRAFVHLRAPLLAGDGISIGDGGTSVSRMFRDGIPVKRAEAGDVVEIPVEHAAGMMAYKTYDRRLMEAVKSSYSTGTRKVKVAISASVKVGQPPVIRMSDGVNEVEARGDYIIENAKNRPVSRDTIIQHLSRLGDTVFEAVPDAHFDENAFVPLSGINEMRRKAVALLSEKRLIRRTCTRKPVVEFSVPAPARPLLAVNAGTLDNLRAAARGGADVVYVGDVYRPDTVDIEECIGFGKSHGIQVYASTPRIVRDGEMDVVKDLLRLDADGFLAGNTAILKMLSGRNVVADYPLNVLNRLSMKFLLDMGAMRVTASPELALTELPHGAECIVHGSSELMISEHCVPGGFEKTCSSPCMNNAFALQDERGYSFPLRMDARCRMHVLNSRELCMLDHVPGLMRAGASALRIEAKAYTAGITEDLTRSYRRAIDGSAEKCTGDYTTGHYFRGVS